MNGNKSTYKYHPYITNIFCSGGASSYKTEAFFVSLPFRKVVSISGKYLLYTGGIYMCFYCRSYIVNKTFSKYNSKSTNNFSFRNELNDIILQKLFRQGGSTFSYLLLPVLYPYRIDFHRF